jgi:6-phosphogluconolactonase
MVNIGLGLGDAALLRYLPYYQLREVPSEAIGGPLVKTATWIAILVAACMTACDGGGPGASKYSVGGTVMGLSGTGLVLQINAGDNLSISSNGPFTFGTGLLDGAAYSVSVATQPINPAQTCTVQNAMGTIDKANVANVSVTCRGPTQFAYVANQLSNNVSAYSLNSSTGVLAPIAGSPFPAIGTAPAALLINGNFLYVADSGSNEVAVFSINGAVGTLSSAGTPSATGATPIALCVDPTGTYLYVANSASSNISAYSIDPATGLLTELSNSPFAAGDGPSSLQVDPTGNYLYVANQISGTVSVLKIDTGSGALSPISGSPFVSGSGAASIVIDPAGAFAYVANETGGSISAFAIDSSTGALNALSGSPIPAVSSPSSLAVDPAGGFLYASSAVNSAAAVAAYSINASTGALTLSGTTASTGITSTGIVLDPTGSFAFVANTGTNNVSVFTVDSASGALTPVSGSPFKSGIQPRAIAVD